MLFRSAVVTPTTTGSRRGEYLHPGVGAGGFVGGPAPYVGGSLGPGGAFALAAEHAGLQVLSETVLRWGGRAGVGSIWDWVWKTERKRKLKCVVCKKTKIHIISPNVSNMKRFFGVTHELCLNIAPYKKRLGNVHPKLCVHRREATP